MSNKRQLKILKAVDGLSIREAAELLLSATDAIVRDADHAQVYDVIGRVLSEVGTEYQIKANFMENDG